MPHSERHTPLRAQSLHSESSEDDDGSAPFQLRPRSLSASRVIHGRTTGVAAGGTADRSADDVPNQPGRSGRARQRTGTLPFFQVPGAVRGGALDNKNRGCFLRINVAAALSWEVGDGITGTTENGRVEGCRREGCRTRADGRRRGGGRRASGLGCPLACAARALTLLRPAAPSAGRERLNPASYPTIRPPPQQASSQQCLPPCAFRSWTCSAVASNGRFPYTFFCPLVPCDQTFDAVQPCTGSVGKRCTAKCVARVKESRGAGVQTIR